VKNVLIEAQNLFSKTASAIKTGAILSVRRDGGFMVSEIGGGQEIVFGVADVGDTVQYQDRKIISRVKTEETKVYRIK
jgi:hypothetical protein